MRILCVISTLGPGGSEKVMSQLAAFLAPRHEVRLVTWEPPDARPFFGLPDSVSVARGNLLGGSGPARVSRILARYRFLSRQVGTFRPDVILSFADVVNVMAIAAGRRHGMPVVASERTDPARHKISRLHVFARRLVYPLADRIVVQTRRVAAFFPASLQKRIMLIANPVELPADAATPDKPGSDRCFRIVAAGRLSHVKGFDRLIEAFALLHRRFPDWQVMIYGEGEERDRLEALIAERHLADGVRLAGWHRNLAGDLAKAHLMAFPSRYEGYPNALAEGLAAGLPAVGFADVSGVEDLIADGENGFLVNEADGAAGFAEALARLMEASALRASMGAAARRRLAGMDRQVYAAWEAVLTETAGASAGHG